MAVMQKKKKRFVHFDFQMLTYWHMFTRTSIINAAMENKEGKKNTKSVYDHGRLQRRVEM
jgi:hypothetical protein